MRSHFFIAVVLFFSNKFALKSIKKKNKNSYFGTRAFEWHRQIK